MNMSGLKFLNKKTAIIVMLATLLLAFAGSAFAAEYSGGVTGGPTQLNWSDVVWYDKDGVPVSPAPNSGDIILSSDNDGNKLNVDVSVDISSLEFGAFVTGHKALTLAISKDADRQFKMTDGKIGFLKNLTITASGDAGARLVLAGRSTNIASKSSSSMLNFTISNDVDIVAPKGHAVSMGGNGNYRIATTNIGSADYVLTGKSLKLDVPEVKTSENNIKGDRVSYIPTLDLASLIVDKREDGHECEFGGNITGSVTVKAEGIFAVTLLGEQYSPRNDRLSAALKVGGDLVIDDGAKLYISTKHLAEMEEKGNKISGEYIIVSSDKDIQVDLTKIDITVFGDHGDAEDVAFGGGGTNRKMIVIPIEGDDDDDEEDLQDVIDNLKQEDKVFLKEGFNLIVKAIDGLDGSTNRPYDAYEKEDGYVAYPEGAKKVEVYVVFLDANKSVDVSPTVNNQVVKTATGSMYDIDRTEVGNSGTTPTPVVDGGALVVIRPLSGTAFESGDYNVEIAGFGGVVYTGIKGFGALADTSIISGTMKVKVKSSSSPHISTGSGGCDAGFGAFALLTPLVLGAAVALRRKD